MTYADWAKRWPQAADELRGVLMSAASTPLESAIKRTRMVDSEDWAQDNAKLLAAQAGGILWRNNVGALPAKQTHICPRCQFRFEVAQGVLRWGLCNESAKVNKSLKSSDLIGIRPIRITSGMVGSVIGQFAAIEVKKPSWAPGERPADEEAQASFLALVGSLGGYATFSRGEL